MAETSDVRSFKDEVSAEFARDRKIEHVRVGGLELVVQSPVDGKRTRIKSSRGCNRVRKLCWRRTNHLLPAESQTRGWKSGEIRKARRTVNVLRTGGIH